MFISDAFIYRAQTGEGAGVMLEVVSRLFEWPLSLIHGARAGRLSEHEKDVRRRVKIIEKHLDNNSKFEANSDAELFAAYNLVDWNKGPVGRISGPIYLGSALALTDTDILHKVGGVITIIDPGRCPKRAVEQALSEAGMKQPNSHLLYLPLDDDPDADISKYFDVSERFLRFHQQQGVPVLVHCMAGMSRSATLLANYLMKKYNINALSALDILKTRRPIVRPNSGFIRQLVEAEPPQQQQVLREL